MIGLAFVFGGALFLGVGLPTERSARGECGDHVIVLGDLDGHGSSLRSAHRTFDPRTDASRIDGRSLRFPIPDDQPSRRGPCQGPSCGGAPAVNAFPPAPIARSERDAGESSFDDHRRATERDGVAFGPPTNDGDSMPGFRQSIERPPRI
ncbi:MAG TPA: hypothetical protein DCQ98_13875 [Planctomycetaceae bacterium]|nr:hypothetical protein [Planctomycetaceae bacterium]